MSDRIRIVSALAVALALALAPAAGHAQIPNAGFESWASGDPTGWATSNVPGFVTPVTQSAIAHSGTSSAKGTVVQFYTAAIQPVLQVGAGGTGFAYTGRPTAITGWYQFYPVGGDRLGINTWLMLGGTSGTPVASAAAAISTGASAWTQFTVPFSYMSSSNPDVAELQFQIVGPVTGSDFHVGSYMLLDDLAFSGAADVDDAPARQAVTGFLAGAPNPFTRSTSIAFTLAHGGPVTLAVYDMQGRAVATLLDGTLDAGTHAAVWNASHAPCGVYWCRLVADGVVLSRKLVRVE